MSCNCKACSKSDCCGIDPCPSAYDDDYVRELMTAIQLGVTAEGGEAGAEAYAALFCTDGCEQGNLGDLTCGRDAILASSLSAQAFLQSLTFSNLTITRTTDPADNNVTVTVFRNADLRLVSDPDTAILSYGVTQLVITPCCCLALETFVDLRP